MFVTYDGKGKAAGTKIYINGKVQEHNIEADGQTAPFKRQKNSVLAAASIQRKPTTLRSTTCACMAVN